MHLVISVDESLAASAADQPVELPAHTFEATLKPRLVISLGGVDWCDIDFELALAATLRSATLHISAGRLTVVQLGQVKGSVKLSCEGTEVREYAREVKLLPEYRLDPPIALAGAERLAGAGSAA